MLEPKAHLGDDRGVIALKLLESASLKEIGKTYNARRGIFGSGHTKRFPGTGSRASWT